MPPVKSRREEYADATRRALVEAAAAAFAARGYTGVSLDEITAVARVTKGALYHHFQGKQALFEEAMDQQERAVHARILAAAGEHPDDLWAGAFAALDAFLDACCDPVYGRLCFIEGPVGLGWERWRAFEHTYAYGLTEALLRGLIAARLVPEGLPVAATTDVAVGMLSHAGIALAEASEQNRATLHRELAAVLRRLLGGLRAG